MDTNAPGRPAESLDFEIVNILMHIHEDRLAKLWRKMFSVNHSVNKDNNSVGAKIQYNG